MIEDLWYKNSLIYNLDLETFMDADGDGVGDFDMTTTGIATAASVTSSAVKKCEIECVRVDETFLTVIFK